MSLNVWLLAPVGLVIAVLCLVRKSGDTRAIAWVLGLAGIGTTLIQILQRFEASSFLYADPRYHVPTIALLYPFVAFALVAFGRRFRAFRVVFAIALLAIFAHNGWTLIKYRLDRYVAGRHRKAVMWAEQLISSDWKGPKREPYVYRHADYRPANRPIVISLYPGLEYWVAGRFHVDSFVFDKPHEKWVEYPDYFFMLDDIERVPRYADAASVYHGPDYEPIGTYEAGDLTFRVYRRKRKVDHDW